MKVLRVMLAMVIAGCAPTTGPVSLPLEVLVILDRDARTLTLVPVDSTSVAATIPLTMAADVAAMALATLPMRPECPEMARRP